MLTLAVAAVTLLLAARAAAAQQLASTSFALSVRNERGALTSLPGRRRRAAATRGCCASRGCSRATTAPRSACSARDGTVLVSTDPDNADAFTTAAQAAPSGKTQRKIAGTGRRAEAEVTFPLDDPRAAA